MESGVAGIPEKRSRWMISAMMIGGVVVAVFGGYSSLFLGFVLCYQVLRMDNSSVWFGLGVFAPFAGWVSVLGFLAFRLRGHAIFPFWAGGVIGILLFLLVLGVCAVRDLSFR